MVLLDDRILELLEEEGFMTPSEIADDDRIPYSAQHVGDRCRKLAEHGLVENVGNGVYRITERGEQYLEGELNMAEDAPEESLDSDTNNGVNGASEPNEAR